MRIDNYIVTVVLIVIVIPSCEMKNGPVEVLSIIASDSVATSGSVVTFKCDAQDVDDDKLTYDWYSSSGNISSYGDSATWTAPNKSGYFHVSCKVSDGIGASDAKSVSIRVVGGVIEGFVTNAVDGSVIEGADVVINGLNAITDSSGNYTIFLSIQNGNYDVESIKDSFCPYSGSFQIDSAPTDAFRYDFSLSPIPEPGEIRMVLNWSSEPPDLDSHIRTPEIEGTSYWIYYGNRGSGETVPFVTLDVDDVNGYGPETITIRQSYTGNYVYYIKDFGQTGQLYFSGGTVQIYNSPDCSGQQIQVSQSGGNGGIYWYVCDIDGDTGDITVINQIQNSEPSN